VAVALLLLPRPAQKLSAQNDYYYNAGSRQRQQNQNYYNYPVNNQYYNSPTANSAAGSFGLTSDAQTYCLGQIPTYTITAPLSWSGQTISWTSSHNGIVTQNSFMLSNNGSQSFWSASGNTWQSGDEGQWTKTALINGQNQVLTLTVQNCGNTGSQTTSSTGFGGSAGSYGDPVLGGSVGSYGDPSIGGSSANTSVNNPANTNLNSYPSGSYIAPNGYICSPPTH